MARTILFAGGLAIFAMWPASPAAAQIDWHAPRQASKPWTKKLQENARKKAAARKRAGLAPATAATGKPLTMAERQAAWNANKTEYRKRLMRDGQPSADRWLDRVALSSR